MGDDDNTGTQIDLTAEDPSDWSDDIEDIKVYDGVTPIVLDDAERAL